MTFQKALSAPPEKSGDLDSAVGKPALKAAGNDGSGGKRAPEPTPFDVRAFRAQLVKIMPGYNWTVHRVGKGAKSITATGVQSSGFNRLNTLEVTLTSKNGFDWYGVRSAGYGLRAPWLADNGGVTLARALRGLQDHYSRLEAIYGGQARALQNARQSQEPKP